MSMGFLMPKNAAGQTDTDAAVVWRGLMVQKATQQLLFDVDWRGPSEGPGLDVLVVDMPPGTGDVALTFGQLVQVDGEKFRLHKLQVSYSQAWCLILQGRSLYLHLRMLLLLMCEKECRCSRKCQFQ